MIRIALYLNHTGDYTVRCSSHGIVHDALPSSRAAQTSLELHRERFHKDADIALYYRFGTSEVLQEARAPREFLAALERRVAPDSEEGSPTRPLSTFLPLSP